MFGRFKRKSDKQKIARVFRGKGRSGRDRLRPWRRSASAVYAAHCLHQRSWRTSDRVDALGVQNFPTACSSMHAPRALPRQISGKDEFLAGRAIAPADAIFERKEDARW